MQPETPSDLEKGSVFIADKINIYMIGVKREDGTEALVVATNDQKTLELYGATSDCRIWIQGYKGLSDDSIRNCCLIITKCLEKAVKYEEAGLSEITFKDADTEFTLL